MTAKQDSVFYRADIHIIKLQLQVYLKMNNDGTGTSTSNIMYKYTIQTKITVILWGYNMHFENEKYSNLNRLMLKFFLTEITVVFWGFQRAF